jgi:IPT/TIG domain
MEMKNSILLAALLLAPAVTAPLRAQPTAPLLTAVEPGSGTYGDVLRVTGENLDQATVAALYLTDGKNDIKLVITEQSATAIKFQIPVGIATGRFALMILTKGQDAKYIEEPVRVTIEPPPAKPTA